MALRLNDRLRARRTPRRCAAGVEALEGRRLLSISPLVGPLPEPRMAVAEMESFKPAGAPEALHHDRALLAIGYGADVQPPSPAKQTDFAGTDSIATRFAASRVDAGAPGSGAAGFLGLAPRIVRQEPILAESVARLPNTDFISRSLLTPLIAFGSQSNRGDAPATRSFVFMVSGAATFDFGQVLGQDAQPPDFHIRYSEFVHDSAIVARLVTSSPDNIHSGSGDVGTGGGTPEGHRHGALSPALIGQSAESESIFAGTGRAAGDARTTNAGVSERTGDLAEKSAAPAIVGHLVAFDDAAAIWAAGLLASRAQAGNDGSIVGAVLHDLLAPRFAFDSAAMGAAISDLLAEADELGVELLGVLTDPASSSELALVAGVVVAGLGYRHWRGSRGRAVAETEQILTARFITGPASSRLGRRAST